MGKPTGFKEWGRVPIPKRDKRARIGDWNEIYLSRSEAESRRQAGRCMDCGVPFCQQGCPLGNHIPDWNDLVYRGLWRDAYDRLVATNNFPEFTGRLCPAPCEAACTLAVNQPAVTIEDVEKEIIERAFAEGWVVARPPSRDTGKHVAIVGSGPAGLAAAAQLRSVGHRVTVYEADDAPGGMLRFGIPDFKMERWPLDRRLALLRAEGIELRCGVRVGVDVGWAELRDSHDALLVCVGARRARPLDVPGADLGGVVDAMSYLVQQNRVVAGQAVPAADRIDAAGKHVVILGGGDTGSDCFGTALRQRAASVRQLQLWPAPPMERTADNPWPAWPLVFRTSSSQEEGGEREFAIMTTRLEGEAGRLRKLHAVYIDEATVGRRAKPVPRVGSEHSLDVDLLIVAIGFIGPEADELVSELNVARDGRGNLVVDRDHATNADGVFAAGDAIRGASLIVWAIADGREAARGIDMYLGAGASPRLPSKGVDLPFFR